MALARNLVYFSFFFPVLVGVLLTLRPDLHRALFVQMLARAGPTVEKCLAPTKSELFSRIKSGSTVFEIGPGAGPNFKFMQDKDIRWRGTEAIPDFRDDLLASASQAGIANVDLVIGDALEELRKLKPNSLDFVVSTHVLCSTEDTVDLLLAIQRALKPGGALLLIEHVAAPEGTSLALVQDLIMPLWKFIGLGCECNRDTKKTVMETGFDVSKLNTLDISHCTGFPPWVKPHIAGEAIKKAN